MSLGDILTIDLAKKQSTPCQEIVRPLTGENLEKYY
jgi:hypothetical protein